MKQLDITQKFQRRAAERRESAALFTDIDRCFWHPDATQSTVQLEQVLVAHSYGLIMLTGKDLPEVLSMPHVFQADVLASAAGTELFVKVQGIYEEHLGYREYLRDQTGWVRSDIVSRLEKIMTELHRQDVAIDWQPSDQADASGVGKSFKISLDLKATSSTMANTRSLLEEIPRVRILISQSSRGTDQYAIDVVPDLAGKGGALEYIQTHIAPITLGFVAGNSGNDFDMLRRGFFPAILVGGASTEAVALLEEVKGEKIADHLYWFASQRGKQKIFVGEEDNEIGPQSILRALSNPLLNPAEHHLFNVA